MSVSFVRAFKIQNFYLPVYSKWALITYLQWKIINIVLINSNTRTAAKAQLKGQVGDRNVACNLVGRFLNQQCVLVSLGKILHAYFPLGSNSLVVHLDKTLANTTQKTLLCFGVVRQWLIHMQDQTNFLLELELNQKLSNEHFRHHCKNLKTSQESIKILYLPVGQPKTFLRRFLPALTDDWQTSSNNTKAKILSFRTSIAVKVVWKGCLRQGGSILP